MIAPSLVVNYRMNGQLCVKQRCVGLMYHEPLAIRATDDGGVVDKAVTPVADHVLRVGKVALDDGRREGQREDAEDDEDDLEEASHADDRRWISDLSGLVAARVVDR